MTQEQPRQEGLAPRDPQAPEPDTSERLYTAEELASYTASRLHTESAPPPPHGDPLTDPLDGAGRPVPEVVEERPTPAAPAASAAAEPAPAPAEEETPEPGVRRFMSATDFLDRRADQVDRGPATWGWRGRVRRWTGGAVSPQMGRAELEHEQQRRSIQRDFAGPRTVAFLNPKGGAAKTTGVLVAGYTFGTVRGGGVVAWDNNETRERSGSAAPAAPTATPPVSCSRTSSGSATSTRRGSVTWGPSSGRRVTPTSTSWPPTSDLTSPG